MALTPPSPCRCFVLQVNRLEAEAASLKELLRLAKISTKQSQDRAKELEEDKSRLKLDAEKQKRDTAASAKILNAKLINMVKDTEAFQKEHKQKLELLEKEAKNAKDLIKRLQGENTTLNDSCSKAKAAANAAAQKQDRARSQVRRRDLCPLLLSFCLTAL